ncbi:hypothetical protein LENED_008789 [Lentinula edodes]|uniref:Uncharacterized protein n=1 Tax=Lentinula edodes TaxID=5353 RepID=A0A1Q3EI55_LENED|nr:hypothetical protein LENED_008789 [Lentinula edodes]
MLREAAFHGRRTRFQMPNVTATSQLNREYQRQASLAPITSTGHGGMDSEESISSVPIVNSTTPSEFGTHHSPPSRTRTPSRSIVASGSQHAGGVSRTDPGPRPALPPRHTRPSQDITPRPQSTGNLVLPSTNNFASPPPTADNPGHERAQDESVLDPSLSSEIPVEDSPENSNMQPRNSRGTSNDLYDHFRRNHQRSNSDPTPVRNLQGPWITMNQTLPDHQVLQADLQEIHHFRMEQIHQADLQEFDHLRVEQVYQAMILQETELQTFPILYVLVL